MELIELKSKICSCFKGDPEDLETILQSVEEDKATFPFNEYEYLICNLVEIDELTFQQYQEIRAEYISENKNLWLFEISGPRRFGEKFAQTYVHGMCPDLKNPSTKTDPNYSGQYDFLLDDIKIEVKSSRAVEQNNDEPLYVKALSRNTDRPFLMNFQQLKPQLCDVFIWVAVFRDEIVVWVMSSNEVLKNPHYSRGQHRGNHGNEGQLHIKQNNINTLNLYELKGGNLEQAIRDAAKRA